MVPKECSKKALALPHATDADFADPAKRPRDAAPGALRVIDDTALRARMIMYRIAEGVQSPRGPQRIKSIIRIYPNYDAPLPQPQGPRGRRGPARGASPAEPSTSSRSHGGPLPTVEQLTALLDRIQHIEAAVSEELQGNVRADIERLKRQISTLEGDDFERAFRELEATMRQRRELAVQIREESFRRIEADGAFAERTFLHLISRTPADA